jgi:hypothetical protein
MSLGNILLQLFCLVVYGASISSSCVVVVVIIVVVVVIITTTTTTTTIIIIEKNKFSTKLAYYRQMQLLGFFV